MMQQSAVQPNSPESCGDLMASGIASTPEPTAVEPDDRWYLAQLKPSGFDRARTNLARQGFASFMPMQKVTRPRCERFSEISRPLFPGYLFVRIPPDQTRWRAINSTYGVARLVALRDRYPSVVPSALIAGLRARCDLNGRLVPVNDLHAGTRVRIVSGPFADTIATIDAVPEAGRAWVLMEMMGQTIRTAVTPRDLERV